MHEVTRCRIGTGCATAPWLASWKELAGDTQGSTIGPKEMLPTQGMGKGSKAMRRSKVMNFLSLSFPGLLCRNTCVSLTGAPSYWCRPPAPGTSSSSSDFLECPFGSHGVFMPMKTGISQDTLEKGKNSPFLSETLVTRRPESRKGNRSFSFYLKPCL